MKFDDIAAVKGKGGLFQILKTTSSGSAVLKPLDNPKGGIFATPGQGMNRLDDITIYARNKDKSIALKSVMQNMLDKFEGTLPIDHNANVEDLRAFMKSIAPEYDVERVYNSDIKKLIKWYALLWQHAPDTLKRDEKSPKSKKDTEKGTKKPTTNTPQKKTAKTTPIKKQAPKKQAPKKQVKKQNNSAQNTAKKQTDTTK